jgi:malate dehydrogenase (oxaloacetate-decarboxylating)(NADP+)
MSNYEHDALEYHERAPRGKIGTYLKKNIDSQLELSLAYSPGVAGPCREIHKDPLNSYLYTSKGNLVGVITNGSAVLGLGAIGPDAAKPVMEGKAMLFKKFANIDVFDIEVKADDPDTFIKVVQSLEPTFGGINLEDIKAPECFYIEETLRKTMSIPVFHDDQHGTAIIAAAAFINALEVTGRKIETVKIVFSGGGAAAIACAQLFLELGLSRDNIIMCDSKGVIYEGRSEGMNPYKERFAAKTKLRTLEDSLKGADAFLGVSAPNVLTPEMIEGMAKDPIIFALANPDPEIHPDLVKKHRPDAIMATGRSDFPNQVNNVLGFPFIFRGALDVGATCVNEEMKRAAVYAISTLAKEDVPEQVLKVYGKGETIQFGRDYLIPKPVDPRVLLRIAPAIAKAAMESGVARYKIDLDEYKEKIEELLGPTKRIMRKIRKRVQSYTQKQQKPINILLTHAHEPRMIRAANEAQQQDLDICLHLLGNKNEILKQAHELGIREFNKNIQFIDPSSHPKLKDYARHLFELRQRRGVSKSIADHMIYNHNYFAAMMLRSGDVDAALTGLVEPYAVAVKPVLEVIGVKDNHTLAGIYMMVVENKLYFFADCTIHVDPNAETLAEIAHAAAEVASRYTQDPIRIAMLSFSSFGSGKYPSNQKIAKAIELLHAKYPDLVVDGEMQADIALNAELQAREFPFCKLQGPANVLVFPRLSAANISYKLLSNITSQAKATGPILVGLNKPFTVLQRSATVEEIANMICITAEQVAHAK